MERLTHDILDASRVWAAAFLGWTITSSNLDMILKLLLAVATLVYMAGKAVYVWRQVLKDKSNDQSNPETDD